MRSVIERNEIVPAELATRLAKEIAMRNIIERLGEDGSMVLPLSIQNLAAEFTLMYLDNLQKQAEIDNL